MQFPKFKLPKIGLVRSPLTEAARLTREGRLQDAVSKLMGGLVKVPKTRPAAKSVTPEAKKSVTPEAKKQGSFTAFDFANEAGARSYKLFVPSAYASKPMPLVIMLHGCTQNPDDFALGTKMNVLAQEQGFLVAYPLQPQSAHMTKCWNWYRPEDQKRGHGEPAIIAGITKQIAKDFKVDRQRIYVAGLSAGGAAAAILAAQYPDIFAAVGIHSGLACGLAIDVSSAMSAMKSHAPKPARAESIKIPTIVFHGDRDSTVNPANADAIVAQHAQSGRFEKSQRKVASESGVISTQTTFANKGAAPEVEQWLIHGAAHAWSGGNARGTYTQSTGPDASAEMLRFFMAHPLKSA